MFITLNNQILSIILGYLVVILVFFLIKKNFGRLILTTLLFLVLTKTIGKGNYLTYIFLGLAGSFTEIIFINFIKNTWDYRDPDLFKIPLWLIPLWGIAALFVVNINQLFETNNILDTVLINLSKMK